MKDLPSLNALIDKLANHEPTPSEKIVKLAKERDCIYDMIERKKQELEKAQESNDIERHPKFCEGFSEECPDLIFPRMEIVMKERNSKKTPTAETALFEKMASAFSAHSRGDKKASLNHFAQLGAAIFRCMEYVQKEVEAGT